MGIIRGGILGGFRKKAGAVIGAYWRSLDVIKGLPRISNKPPTEAQLDQRSKFGLVTSFLSNVSDMIDVGYKALSGVQTPMNVAVSYHLRNAVTGTSPNFVMDYPEVKFSQGKVRMPDDIQLATTSVAEIELTWVHSGPDAKLKKAADKLSVVVYNPAKDDFVALPDVALRSAQTYTVILPADYSLDTVHVYISFKDALDKLKVSDSGYVGSTAIL
jgi:hypothetical protein